MNFGKRPHRRIVTARGGEWIRPTLTPSDTWFLGQPSNGISITIGFCIYRSKVSECFSVGEDNPEIAPSFRDVWTSI